jgi:dual 3',5'-cyclic-AMP and -GMP phosphodiesterase 11
MGFFKIYLLLKNRKRGSFLNLVKTSTPLDVWSHEDNRSLLRAMSMTVCDLSAITKPWEIEKRVADLVSSEFFEQGDMERHELKITPIDIMNREKEDQLPIMQVGFIDSICLPIYEVKFSALKTSSTKIFGFKTKTFRISFRLLQTCQRHLSHSLRE